MTKVPAWICYKLAISATAGVVNQQNGLKLLCDLSDWYTCHFGFTVTYHNHSFPPTSRLRMVVTAPSFELKLTQQIITAIMQMDGKLQWKVRALAFLLQTHLPKLYSNCFRHAWLNPKPAQYAPPAPSPLFPLSRGQRWMELQPCNLQRLIITKPPIAFNYNMCPLWLIVCLHSGVLLVLMHSPLHCSLKPTTQYTSESCC